MKPITIRLLKILAGLVVAALVLHTVLLVASGIALRNARAELRAAGRPMSPEEIIPADVPTDQNAAPLYESAFALLKSQTVAGQDLIHAMGLVAREYAAEPDSAEKREALERLVANETVSQALDLVALAVARPHCNFRLQYDQGAMLLMPHVNSLLTLGRFFSAKAILATKQGNRTNAWQNVEYSLCMADALRSEPVLISALVRVALYKMAMGSLQSLCNEGLPDDETADRMADQLSETDVVGPYVLALDGERLFMGEWAFNWVNTRKMIELSPDMGGCNFPLWLATQAMGYRPARQADHAMYLREMEKFTERAGRPYWENPPLLQEDSARHLPWYGMISHIITPSLANSITRMVHVQALIRVARAGLALRRHQAAHGAYPATLSEIDPRFLGEIPIDPFTGQPLVYRREGDGFVLYSFGDNLADDHGTPEPPSAGGTRDFDLVWRSAR